MGPGSRWAVAQFPNRQPQGQLVEDGKLTRRVALDSHCPNRELTGDFSGLLGICFKRKTNSAKLLSAPPGSPPFLACPHVRRSLTIRENIFGSYRDFR